MERKKKGTAMGVKELILTELENHRGSYLSGGDLSTRLNVSRTAVWKAVRSLLDQGYQIDAVTNKGYCLHTDTDILSSQGIEKYLGARSGRFRFYIYDTLSSTNLTARDLAAAGEPEGAVVISGGQISGRGRLGRSFFSPSGTGLYMSLLLRPSLKAPDTPLITSAAAAAAACAVDGLTSLWIPPSLWRPAQIKWVNDIYLGGRKICGILTEASLDLEGGGLEYAVLGIGINIRPPANGFPEELNGIAGSCTDFPEQQSDAGGSVPSDLRCRLAASVLDHFFNYYETLAEKPFLEEYRKRSLVTGKDIRILSGSGTVNAHVLEIDDNCRLTVRLDDGSIRRLSSGEISIRNL